MMATQALSIDGYQDGQQVTARALFCTRISRQPGRERRERRVCWGGGRAPGGAGWAFRV